MEKLPIILRGNAEDKNEELEVIQRTLDDWSKEGAIKLEGEEDKSAEELTKIAMVNSYLSEILDGLELESESIPPERVHFLSNEVFSAQFSQKPAAEPHGFSDPNKRAIYINKEFLSGDPKLDALYNFGTLLHETIHYYSKNKAIADTDQQFLNTYRSGYKVSNLEKSYFIGLNEGIVSLAEVNLLMSNKEEIAKELGITPDDIGSAPRTAYSQNMDLVQKLADVTSKLRGEPYNDSFSRLLDEQFTGNLMHLRDIEKVYGEGTLRLLSRYGSENDKKLDDLIFTFFSSDEAKERSIISTNITEHDSTKDTE